MKNNKKSIIADLLLAIANNNEDKANTILKSLNEQPALKAKILCHQTLPNQHIVDYAAQAGCYGIACSFLQSGAEFITRAAQDAFVLDLFKVNDIRLIFRLLLILKVRNDISFALAELAKNASLSNRPEVVRWVLGLSSAEWAKAIADTGAHYLNGYRKKIYQLEFDKTTQAISGQAGQNQFSESETELVKLYKHARLCVRASAAFWESEPALAVCKNALQVEHVNANLVVQVLLNIAISPIVWHSKHPLIALLLQVKQSSWVTAQEIAKKELDHVQLLALKKTVLELTGQKSTKEYEKISVNKVLVAQQCQAVIASFANSAASDLEVVLSSAKEERLSNVFRQMASAENAVIHGSSLRFAMQDSFSDLVMMYCSMIMSGMQADYLDKLSGSFNDCLGTLHEGIINQDFLSNCFSMLSRVNDAENINSMSRVLLLLWKKTYIKFTDMNEKAAEFANHFVVNMLSADHGHMYDDTVTISLKILTECKDVTITSGLLNSLVICILNLKKQTSQGFYLDLLSDMLLARPDIQLDNKLANKCMNALILHQSSGAKDSFRNAVIMIAFRLSNAMPLLLGKMQEIAGTIKRKYTYEDACLIFCKLINEFERSKRVNGPQIRLLYDILHHLILSSKKHSPELMHAAQSLANAALLDPSYRFATPDKSKSDVLWRSLDHKMYKSGSGVFIRMVYIVCFQAVNFLGENPGAMKGLLKDLSSAYFIEYVVQNNIDLSGAVQSIISLGDAGLLSFAWPELRDLVAVLEMHKSENLDKTVANIKERIACEVQKELLVAPALLIGEPVSNLDLIADFNTSIEQALADTSQVAAPLVVSHHHLDLFSVENAEPVEKKFFKESLGRNNLFAKGFAAHVLAVLSSESKNLEQMLARIAKHDFFYDTSNQNVIQEVFWHLGNSEILLDGYSLNEQLNMVKSLLLCLDAHAEEICHPYAISRVIYSAGRLANKVSLVAQDDIPCLTMLVARFIADQSSRKEHYIPLVVSGLSYLHCFYSELENASYISELLALLSSVPALGNPIDYTYLICGLERLNGFGMALPEREINIMVDGMLSELRERNQTEVVVDCVNRLNQFLSIFNKADQASVSVQSEQQGVLQARTWVKVNVDSLFASVLPQPVLSDYICSVLTSALRLSQANLAMPGGVILHSLLMHPELAGKSNRAVMGVVLDVMMQQPDEALSMKMLKLLKQDLVGMVVNPAPGWRLFRASQNANSEAVASSLEKFWAQKP